MSTEISKWLNLYRKSDLEGQAGLVRNCIVKAANPSSREHELARVLLEEFKCLWKENYQELPDFLTKERPKWGVMRAVGYNVGIHGVSQEQRRNILEFVFNAEELPPIQDKAYRAEWGFSRRTERFSKIVRFLKAKTLEELDYEDLSEAADDRILDLKFVERQLYPLIDRSPLTRLEAK